MAESMGFNPVVVNSVTYIGTIAVFLVAMKVPKISLPYFPATGSLLLSNDAHFAANQDLEYLFIGIWSVHFLRRSVEVLFVHDYRRRMPFIESIGAPIYYWFFAFWIGVALRHDNGYKQTYLALIVVGSIIFFLGECGNCYCHLKLRAFRKEKIEDSLSQKSQHAIPHGFLFEFVSCPHYLCEILSWLGFFLASWALPAALFLLATIITLVTYSFKKHKAYQQEFDGPAGRELYPKNRKALIPFIFWDPPSKQYPPATLLYHLPHALTPLAPSIYTGTGYCALATHWLDFQTKSVWLYGRLIEES